MAINEKVVYASEHVTHDGRLYRPGEQLSGQMADQAVSSAVERGLTTDSHAAAERAAQSEQERQADVSRQIETRSEKRQGDQPGQGRKVIQMPDGSFRLVE